MNIIYPPPVTSITLDYSKKLLITQGEDGDLTVFQDISNNWGNTVFSNAIEASITINEDIVLNILDVVQNAQTKLDLIYFLSERLSDGAYDYTYKIIIQSGNITSTYITNGKFYLYNDLKTLLYTKSTQLGQLAFTKERHNPKVQNYIDSIFDCTLNFNALQIASLNQDATGFNLLYNSIMDTLKYLIF